MFFLFGKRKNQRNPLLSFVKESRQRKLHFALPRAVCRRKYMQILSFFALRTAARKRVAGQSPAVQEVN